VINAAAYTAVDRAETERDLCWQCNAVAPGTVAELCRDIDAFLVHYSTDYVFSGEGSTPWREDDSISPCNHYGSSKADGERRIRESACRHLILRTSWVFAPEGKNFLLTMMALFRSRAEVSVVADQLGAPTSSDLVARATARLIERRAEGTIHVTAEGTCSWFEFATWIRDECVKRSPGEAWANVRPIPSSDYPTPARRPKNSRLSGEKLQQALGVPQSSWQDDARAVMNEIWLKPR
jgi:dTDP-4-dehydrorhamnose reductase